MSLAFCVYNLAIEVVGALNVFTQIADHLGLADQRVMVGALERKWSRRLPLDLSDSTNSLFSAMDNFAFTIAFGDQNAAMLRNSAAYVSYMRLAGRDSMSLFSPQQADLRDFAERFMPGLPAKYGFGTDWSRPGSFCGYVHGFEDSRSLGGDHLGQSQAGRWGELFDSEPAFFDQGRFRDVYSVNLLTSAHLNHKTRDGTVRDLILEHADWGVIRPLADNWFMWWVPPEGIEQARSEFLSRGLLENV
ncbi:MAG: hypothetical protein ABSD74_20815 [Rhizomicrobium sp.]|jgi:hypothetical protein